MKTIFSTKDLHPRDRFEYWHDVACRELVRHNAVPEHPPAFDASMDAGSLGGLEIVQFENSPMSVERNTGHLLSSDSDELFVCCQVSGTVVLSQGGRDALLQPGDMTLLDPQAPYRAKFMRDSKVLVVKPNRRIIEARLGRIGDETARVIRPSTAEASLASSVLRMLPPELGRFSSESEELVREHTLDLVCVALTTSLGKDESRKSASRSMTLMRLRAVVDALLTDPELTACRVVAVAGVSMRYANALLASEGTSIMRLVWERRLARCRQALEDPAQSHRSVSEIAYGWGFSDMTHFGRRYRDRYGLLPSEWRKRHVEASL